MKKNKITAVLGPTNTGKTFLAIETMLSFDTGMMGFPLRLLAREVYDKVIKKVDPQKVALITGEEKIIPVNAKYYFCTVESMPVDKILDFVEDVGRHNAVDAIAGHMWLNNIEGEGKIFYTTGRLTSEMVIKVAQMNISTLLSRSGITEMGLNVAIDTQVTLLGRAKGKHFLIYNGKDNIIFDAMPDPRPDGASDVWKRR